MSLNLIIEDEDMIVDLTIEDEEMSLDLTIEDKEKPVGEQAIKNAIERESMKLESTVKIKATKKKTLPATSQKQHIVFARKLFLRLKYLK